MVVVHVQIRVKPECLGAFREATVENSRRSLKEPGVLRFDVMQQLDDPERFVLVEAYRDEAAVLAHKETAHYAAWRDTVADMMAEPRRGTRYAAVHPGDEGW